MSWKSGTTRSVKPLHEGQEGDYKTDGPVEATHGWGRGGPSVAEVLESRDESDISLLVHNENKTQFSPTLSAAMAKHYSFPSFYFG